MPEDERLDHVVRLRLKEAQAAYVGLCAARWDCSVAEAIRRLIEEALDAEPPVEIDGIEFSSFPGQPVPLRHLLAVLRPAPEWVRRQFGREDGSK